MNIKSLSMILALGAVASANAVTFSLTTQSKGIYLSALGNIGVHDTVVLPTSSYAPATFTLTDLAYSFAATPGATAGTGTLTLTRTSDSAVSHVAISFAGNYLPGSGVSGSFRTAANAVTLTGVDGWLLGYAGTGKLTDTLVNGDLSTRTSFTGTLNAVPEPASMAALAVGGFGLLRRRRKA